MDAVGDRDWIADIVRHAKTSKRTFYEQFASKAECLIELLRRNNENLIAGIRSSVDPEADFKMIWEVDAKAQKRLNDIALDSQIEIRNITCADDNLQSVFDYLVH